MSSKPEWPSSERIFAEWDQAMRFAHDVLLNGKVSERVRFLQDELLSLCEQELGSRETTDVLSHLISTYPRYTDAESRGAVERVGTALARRDSTVAEQIVAWLDAQSAHASAPGDVYALLCWSCALLPSGDYIPAAGRPYARAGRALRGVSNELPPIMRLLIKMRAIPLLGVTIDVMIHLKNTSEPIEARLEPELKSAVLELYCKDVLESRSTAPPHVLKSLDLYIRTYVDPSAFDAVVLPSLEKALNRGLVPGPRAFLSTYTKPVPVPAFRLLLPHILTLAKSPNATTRDVVELFRATVARLREGTDVEIGIELDQTREAILALPRARKTASAAHRTALYGMLGCLEVPANVDQGVTALLALLTSETAPEAAEALGGVLEGWISALLASDVPVKKAGDAGTAVVRGMGLKTGPGAAGVRRACWTLGAEVLWAGQRDTEAYATFARALLPAFDTALTAVGTGIGAKDDALWEAYVAAACLLRLATGGKSGGELVKQAAGLAAVRAIVAPSGDKPPWMFNERVYSRVGTTKEAVSGQASEQEAVWFVRALDGVWAAGGGASIHLRLGSTLLHFALRSQPATRTAVLDVVRAHQDAGAVVRAGLAAYTARNADAAGIETRLAAFLAAGVGSSEETVAEVVVLAHHRLANSPGRQTWIDVCQRAGQDPREVVVRRLDRIVEIVLAGAAEDSKTGLPDAAYSTLTTLVFVAPDIVLPRIVEILQADIDPATFNALTEEDLGMWRMPEGSTFIDVLSSTKGEPKATHKGKDFEIARWEAEVRTALENKRKAGASVALTKPQQALVQAQLAREAIVRQRVESVKADLIRGLAFVRSLVAAGVPEFRVYISSIVGLLLDGALGKGALLAGPAAFETYLDLAKCSSERLMTFRTWVGIATLRSLKIDSVPEELTAEPLPQCVVRLVIRVLHRLRSLAEQAPFDSATFSYAFPLLAQVLTLGGIDPEDEEEALEQVALALDYHQVSLCRMFSPTTAFPRKQTMEILLQIIRQQPKLSKEASSTLIDLGEVAHANASREELDVLLDGTLMQEVYVRNSCLQALQPFDLTDLDWSPKLWVACHDDDEQNGRLARHVWEDNGLDVPELFLQQLLPLLGHDNAYVRRGAAAAIAESIEHWPQAIHSTLVALQEYYRDKAKILAPEFDQYGMVIAASLDRSDPWQARVAASHAFELLSPLLPEDEVEPFFAFLIQDEALGDRTAEVRRGMLSAGNAVIDLHGAARLPALISMFENHLGQPSPATETGDQIKEAVVILFGRVARHLDATDSRVPAIVERLVDALKTPAEQVQMAVSECLSPLVKVMGSKVAQLVDDLLEQLFNAPKYATRRGAAYGLAGVLKGTGIVGMKQFDIIRRLKIAAEDKKRYEPRQGTMFAFETLSTTLGRLFEPYITYVLPLLLTSFGDSTADVREATQDAARIIMGNMSGYGVKLILPSLLSGFGRETMADEEGFHRAAWHDGVLLSAAALALAAHLRTAANKSLKQFALVDPAKTPNALASLLKTSFMHYIDNSSLALVVPILERGLRERGADTKKKAAQIVGNLASLTDSKDFVPYLAGLLPMVHQVLVDPVPEARATAAKALGTLVERLGEVHFPDLVPGLLRTLKTDTSGVDRQGAAQGLSEVLSGLGMERLEGLLPDIIANAQSPRATVREGFMSLLVFLPATFGSRFQPHLPKIIAPILSGLADVEEYVREAAMRAGRMVVTNYSSKAIDLLLPELEQGMFDSGWRIRQSSITLVGELLFKVSGISGKPSDLDEDEVAGEGAVNESSRRALVEILGVERRDRILAALYLVRQDGVGVVRQSSIQIWKALVNNTPRTVREILPELVRQILHLISSDEFEQQETAGRTVGEICRKFGDRILGEVMTILRTNSTSTDSRTREGVCLMLSEIMENSTDTQREGHEDDFISIVRMSLVDDESNVRSAAAKAFDILQEHLGAKAIDETIPTLLDALRQPGKGSGTALQALREVMSVRASTVFPVLIPTLTAIPMTLFNARALAALVTVAGGALSRRLSVILSALVRVVEDDKDEELQAAVDEAIRALFASISDAEGLNTLMLLLLGWAKHETPKRRVSACNFFAIFCEESDLDSSLYRVDWVRQLISLFEDSQVPVHTAAWTSFDVIESTGGPGHYVPGFGLPKGVAPAVPIIIAGLTTGSNEQREQAAYAIGDLVERTEENAIKPYVVPFTGPLIRVATQATTYPPAVKTAILSALTSMLERIPAFVKPFFPQLQRTFVKSASDPASVVVRNKAAQALGVLMRSQPRVDPVVTELVTGINSNDDAIASSLILALSNVVKSASQHLGEKARESCVELATEAFREPHDENYGQAIADLVSSLAIYSELLRPLVEAYLIGGTPLSVVASHTIVALLTPDQDNFQEQNLFQKLSLLRSVAQKVQESAASDKPFIARPAREARDLLKELEDESLQGFF
ncbi:armadillo-type protein [Mycena metata]|uniref:Armadillo-type protein n=1 Tax=Mycena metata TaxID=1033252 RepID=A0AAD7JCS2_9AGAR|nr:armadillo-type protein [Mycena metata]